WRTLQQALAIAPSDPLVIADLADLAEALGRYDELAALVAGWQEQEVDPSRALALALRRADALVRSGQDDAARTLLSTLGATAPGYLPLLAMRERDALGRGDRAELAEIYAAMAEAARAGTTFGIDEEPRPDRHTAASFDLVAGDLFHRQGRVDEARVRYTRALEAAPDLAAALEALVALHEETGQLEDAAILLEARV